MAQKWASGYALRWTPILTFTKRRLRLLDWFEQHTEPVSFYEDPETVGIALVDPGLRLTLNRDGMRISANAADLDLDHLSPAVQGVFEVMAPQDAVLETAMSTWTLELDGADYNEARALAACRMSGVDRVLEDGSFRAVDGSALVDFESTEAIVQLEWGIVEAAEFVERLKDPRLGRHSGVIRPPHADRMPDHLPDVAMLADVLVRRRVGGQVGSARNLMERVWEADRVASMIATSVYEGHWKGKGTDEFAQIG